MTIWYSSEQTYLSNYVPYNSRHHRSNTDKQPSRYQHHIITNHVNYREDENEQDRNDDDVDVEEEVDDDNNNNENDILSYLPDYGDSIPPMMKMLLRNATMRYVQQPQQQQPQESYRLSYHDVAVAIEKEYMTRDVPVMIYDITTTTVSDDGDNDDVALSTSFDVTNTGQEMDETIAELLSLCAIHAVPMPIVIELFKSISFVIPHHGRMITNNHENSNNMQRQLINYQDKIDDLIITLQEQGWSSIHFPHGLAVVQPKQKQYAQYLPLYHYQQQEQQQHNPNHMNWLIRIRSLGNKHNNKKEIANMAIQMASEVLPPPRQPLLSRQEFLLSLEQQMRHNHHDHDDSSNIPSISVTSSWNHPNHIEGDPKTSSSSSSPPKDTELVPTSNVMVPNHNNMMYTTKLFFPNSNIDSMSYLHLLVRRTKRYTKRLYTTLQEQGRSGLVAYCSFNFIYYTIGMIYQYQQMSISSLLVSSSSSSSTLSSMTTIPAAAAAVLSFPYDSDYRMNLIKQCLWKFGKAFAYVFALSPVLKIPSFLTSIMIAPIISKLLQRTQKIIPSLSETKLSILYIGILLLLWFTITSIPLLHEYNIIFQQMKQYYDQEEYLMSCYSTSFLVV